MHKQIKQWLVIFASFCAIIFGPDAIARDDEFALQAGVEKFRWQEFNNGSRILEERGTLFNIGATLSTFRRSDPGTLYNLNGRLYLGQVDYDGQACNIISNNCIPSKTHTNYNGLQGEGLAGYHFGDQFGFDLLGGAGIDNWIREIKDTATAGGAIEDYVIFYAKLGAGLSINSEQWAYRFHAGIKYPFLTYEHSDAADNGVDLTPGKRVSGFAKFDAEFGAKNQPHFGLTIFYDSYRFGMSPRESVTIQGLPKLMWQPESHMDIIGAQLAYYVF